jgi:hypothetical protein
LFEKSFPSAMLIIHKNIIGLMLHAPSAPPRPPPLVVNNNIYVFCEKLGGLKIKNLKKEPHYHI